MRAIGYIRVSTEEQVRDGVSLDDQRERITAWAVAMGYELAEVHEDAGISGYRLDKRPGLQDAIASVTKSGGVLVVAAMSRLSRSTKEMIEISEVLSKAGADLVSLSERIDTTSAAGKMIFRLLAVLNEFERDQISERVKNAMDYKRRNNKLIGKVPFGFNLAMDGESLIKNKAEQRVLTLICKLDDQGQSLRQIARELTDRGIPTKESRQKWQHATVARILKRTA